MLLMVDQDRKLVEKAAFGVFCLAMHSRVLPKLRDVGAVQPLVTVVAEGQTAAQSYAAGALMYMAFHGACRGEIVSLGGVLPLVNLLSSSSRRCQGHAAGAPGAVSVLQFVLCICTTWGWRLICVLPVGMRELSI